jgi:hypothetical protein
MWEHVSHCRSVFKRGLQILSSPRTFSVCQDTSEELSSWWLLFWTPFKSERARPSVEKREILGPPGSPDKSDDRRRRRALRENLEKEYTAATASQIHQHVEQLHIVDSHSFLERLTHSQFVLRMTRRTAHHGRPEARRSLSQILEARSRWYRQQLQRLKQTHWKALEEPGRLMRKATNIVLIKTLRKCWGVQSLLSHVNDIWQNLTEL